MLHIFSANVKSPKLSCVLCEMYYILFADRILEDLTASVIEPAWSCLCCCKAESRMAKTKGAREPPSKIAKSAAASAKKVEEADGEVSEASTMASSCFRMDTPLMEGGDITIKQLMEDEEISFKEAVGVAMRLREETKEFLAAAAAEQELSDLAEPAEPEPAPKPTKARKVKPTRGSAVAAKEKVEAGGEHLPDVHTSSASGSGSAGSKTPEPTGVESKPDAKANPTASKVKPTCRVKDVPSKAKDDSATKVDDTASKVKPTGRVKDLPSKAKDDPATKVKSTRKLAPVVVSTEKPADPDAIESAEPSPQLKAFWDKYKVSNKGVVDDSVPETVPEATLDDTIEEAAPKLRRGRASTDLSESVENPLPPVAVRRGW